MSRERNEELFKFYGDCLIDFEAKCLEKLDQQEYQLQGEKAKVCAVQAIRHVLRERLHDPAYGMDYIMHVISGQGSNVKNI